MALSCARAQKRDLSTEEKRTRHACRFSGQTIVERDSAADCRLPHAAGSQALLPTGLVQQTNPESPRHYQSHHFGRQAPSLIACMQQALAL